MELRFLAICDTCWNTASSDVKQLVLINRHCLWSSQQDVHNTMCCLKRNYLRPNTSFSNKEKGMELNVISQDVCVEDSKEETGVFLEIWRMSKIRLNVPKLMRSWTTPTIGQCQSPPIYSRNWCPGSSIWIWGRTSLLHWNRLPREVEESASLEMFMVLILYHVL